MLHITQILTNVETIPIIVVHWLHAKILLGPTTAHAIVGTLAVVLNAKVRQKNHNMKKKKRKNKNKNHKQKINQK